jgi:membrane glycosyltransferase
VPGGHRWRRALFAGVCGATWLAAVATMAALLAGDGLAPVEALLLICFCLSIPMVVIGFWNSAIGAAILLAARNHLDVVAPFHRNRVKRSNARVAIAMPVFNEDTNRVFRHLQKLLASLDSLGVGDRYEVFLLSDSTDPEIRADELRRMRAWQQADADGAARLHYRHRNDNQGYKAGNLWEFVETRGTDFDYMVVLDADSAMHGRTVDRLVRIMDANPNLGILQSLAVGMPSESAFARIFQFGMRHGMLVHTVGAAWWQGDACPYWGHNAVIRTDAFKQFCHLEPLPGRPPLGGDILSHDQVEAALMHAGGYEVRVLPVEGGSYEEMPPTLPDFIKRDLRWCQGNMQYLQLLGKRWFTGMGRANLTLAILMYTGAPAWLLFMILGMSQAVVGTFGPQLEMGGFMGRPGPEVAIALFVTMMGITFAPKLIGYTHALLDPARRRAYGGGLHVIGGGLAELFFSMLIAPVVMLAQSVFVAGLFLGRKVKWEAQVRDGHRVSWKDAAKGMWPQTLFGLTAGGLLATYAPAVLPWAAPVLIGLLLAVPMTVVTSSPALGRTLARRGVCAIPEERRPGAPVPTRPRAVPDPGAGRPGFPQRAAGSRPD